MRRYGIGPYEMQQGVVVFTSGTRSQVVTWEDLVEPELDLDGEPSPALHAWRGEAAFLSAILTVTSDDPLRICFSAGHGEPDIESMADGGYATFADELRRDGDLVRALERWATPPRSAAACWWWPSRHRRCRHPSSPRCDRSSTAAVACW